MKRLVIALAALTLAGCGAEPIVPEGQQAHGHGASSAAPPVPAADARFNDADVMFTQMMVDHLQLGIGLSQVALTKATKQKDLADAIDATQREELAMLRSWLKLWGKPEGGGANLHAAHGGQPLLDDKVIDGTKAKSGTEFDLTFLNLMAGHQGAAVEMAVTEKKDGKNPEAIAYAERVATTRQDQISQLLKAISEQ